MANYVFKQFCSDLDQGSLDHLLEIVSRPIAANELDMLEEDSSEDEDDYDSEEGVQGAEEEDGSADLESLSD